MAKAKNPVPEGFHTVTPQLTLDNAAPAIEWYKKALGADEVAKHTGPDGKIMHSELRIGDSLIMLNDAMGGGKGPNAYGGSPMSLWVYVEVCDALFKRAVAAGAKVLDGPRGAMADQFWVIAAERSTTRTGTAGRSRLARRISHLANWISGRKSGCSSSRRRQPTSRGHGRASRVAAPRDTRSRSEAGGQGPPLQHEDTTGGGRALGPPLRHEGRRTVSRRRWRPGL